MTTLTPQRVFAGGRLDAYRFIVAHELTHVLDALPWVVPAFRVWDAFCDVVNPGGRAADTLVYDHVTYGEVLDDYAGETSGDDRAVLACPRQGVVRRLQRLPRSVYLIGQASETLAERQRRA